MLGRIVGGGHQLTSNRMGVALAAALLIASSALPRQVAAEQQAAAQPQPAAEPRLTLMAVGDIMLGRSVGRALVAQGASVPFAKVAETFRSADLVVGNLECVISSLGTPAPKSYHLRAPYEAVESLAGAGFAVVNLANNHAMDFGYDAMADMRKRLADRGIASAGAGADEAEAHSAVVVLRGGLRVAFLGYVDVPVEGLTKFATSSWVALGDKPGLAWADSSRIDADVRAAKERADVVVVFLHSGIEGSRAVTQGQMRDARAAIDAGAARSWERIPTSSSGPSSIMAGSSPTAWATSSSTASIRRETIRLSSRVVVVRRGGRVSMASDRGRARGAATRLGQGGGCGPRAAEVAERYSTVNFGFPKTGRPSASHENTWM